MSKLAAFHVHYHVRGRDDDDAGRLRWMPVRPSVSHARAVAVADEPPSKKSKQFDSKGRVRRGDQSP